MKELAIQVSEEGVLRVILDGRQVGLLQELSVYAGTDGNTSVRLKFPPKSVTDRLGEESRRVLEENISSLEGIPWVELERGSSPAAALSPLLAYIEGTGRDSSGMTMDQVLEKDPSWYERSHDFVQWLLPTRRRSLYEPGAPTLTDDDLRAFRVRSDLQRRYLRGASRMERFLGLQNGQGGRPSWVRDRDHNHKRISRLLESLRDLGFQDRADQVLAAVMGVATEFPGVINAESVEFWKRAAGVGA